MKSARILVAITILSGCSSEPYPIYAGYQSWGQIQAQQAEKIKKLEVQQQADMRTIIAQAEDMERMRELIRGPMTINVVMPKPEVDEAKPEAKLSKENISLGGLSAIALGIVAKFLMDRRKKRKATPTQENPHA